MAISSVWTIGRSSLSRGALLACMLSALVACGSTKVITAEKTLVYRGTLYSLEGVRSVSAVLEATTPEGEVLDVLRWERSQMNDLLDRYDSVALRSKLMLDAREVLYEQKSVKSSREFRKLQGDIENAMDKVVDFMANPKKTQLKL